MQSFNGICHQPAGLHILFHRRCKVHRDAYAFTDQSLGDFNGLHFDDGVEVDGGTPCGRFQLEADAGLGQAGHHQGQSRQLRQRNVRAPHPLVVRARDEAQVFGEQGKRHEVGDLHRPVEHREVDAALQNHGVQRRREPLHDAQAHVGQTPVHGPGEGDGQQQRQSGRHAHGHGAARIALQRNHVLFHLFGVAQQEGHALQQKECFFRGRGAARMAHEQLDP
ncbi:hypothetical protein D3C78_1304850 [compost metagenome]